MVPGGLEPRTLRLLAVRSNQLSYETVEDPGLAFERLCHRMPTSQDAWSEWQKRMFRSNRSPYSSLMDIIDYWALSERIKDIEEDSKYIQKQNGLGILPSPQNIFPSSSGRNKKYVSKTYFVCKGIFLPPERIFPSSEGLAISPEWIFLFPNVFFFFSEAS